MFEPENELGVIFVFGMLVNSSGYELISMRSSFPDAIIKDIATDTEYRVEFEYLASNFMKHKHDPRRCELIICWINDLSDEFPVMVWELADRHISSVFPPIQLYPEEEKEIAFLRAENRYLRKKIGWSNNNYGLEYLPDDENERANEILSVIDALYREHGNQTNFSQADVCRRVQLERTGSETGFETLKSYVNKVAKNWIRPEERERYDEQK